MNSTTNILDLPIETPGSNRPNENNTNITETPKQNDINNLDNNTINQIINGLKQASTTGVTQLQSRDIPQSTEMLTQDEQIQPNYIPHCQNQKDYIKEYETNESIMHNYHENMTKKNNLDEMYNEIQIPLLLAVLYFLFQLPIFRKYLFRYLPFLFYNDGNFNINGYLFTSIIFSTMYYILSKITNYFTS